MSQLSNLKARIRFLGGDQLGRLQAEKLRSFKSALKNSYQSATIEKLPSLESYQCLLNPDNISPDYDNKIISIDFDAGFSAGTVFKWLENDTYWLVYLPELTETAYFRAYVRRCKNKISINNNDYYIYIKDAIENSMDWNEENQISWNSLNNSIVIYITRTDESVEYLKRFNLIDINDKKWRVESVNSLGIEGILEVRLKEYFINSFADLEIQLSGAVMNPMLPNISGASIVEPYAIEDYSIKLASGGVWSISNDKAKILTPDLSADNITIEILSGRSGTFDLIYTRQGQPEIVLPIIIKSL